MRLILVLLIFFVCFVSVNIPQTAHATYVLANQPHIKLIGYDPYCGCPIYAQWVIVGYDYYRRPIWQWRRLPIVHRCGRR